MCQPRIGIFFFVLYIYIIEEKKTNLLYLFKKVLTIIEKRIKREEKQGLLGALVLFCFS